MVTLLRLCWQRTLDFSQREFDFILLFCKERLDLYRYRWYSYNFFQWWGLFIWFCFFGLPYGLLRFTIYSLTLGLRMLMIPVRLCLEKTLFPSTTQRVLLWICGWLESFFGLFWIRQWLFGPFRRRLLSAFQRWKATIVKFFSDNPLYRLALFIEYWDSRTDAYLQQGASWYRRVIRHHFLGLVLPRFYRKWSYWFGVRWRVTRFLWTHKPLIRYRRRFRSRYLTKLSEGYEPFLWLSKIFRFFLKVPWWLYNGFRFLFLLAKGFYFTLRSFFPSSPPLLGFRYRKPKPGRRRFRIKRNWWDNE